MPWQLVGNIRGPQGNTGSPGSTWEAGSGSPITPGTVPGDSYLDGSTGDVYVWNGTSWVQSVNIRGPQGAEGPAGVGNTWATGTGAPITPGALTGDMYLDTSDGDVYEWLGTSWGLVGNLTGPEGPPGDPNMLAPIALSGSADDLTSGTIPEGVLPDRLKAVSVTLVTTGQVDAATSAGFYGVDAAGSPTGAAGSLLVLNGGGTPTQVFTSSVSGRMHARVSESGVWGEWNPVAYLDVSRWVTEDGDGVTTEDGDQITFITGVR